MYGELFTLVSTDNPNQIFAWGMQITETDVQTAIVWRREPGTGTATVGTHVSADAACTRFSMITPLRVVWESDLCAEPVES